MTERREDENEVGGTEVARTAPLPSPGPADTFVLRRLFDPAQDGDSTPDVLVQSQRIGGGDVWRIEDLGVRAVVDLTSVEVAARERATAAAALAQRGIALIHLPVRGPDDVAAACEALLREVRAASALRQAVVVHCHGGVNRSVCVAAAVKAHREGTTFAHQLFELIQAWDDIAVTDPIARAADDWTKARSHLGPLDDPDPGVECPHCRDHIVRGRCQCEECDHTACPFCGDGRGTLADGCTHLVMECHEVVPTDGAPGDGGGVLHLVWSRLPDTVPMPYLAMPGANGRPPGRPALAVAAARMAGACVRANTFLDFDAHMQRIDPAVVRVYSINPDACAARIVNALVALGE